MAEQSTAKRHRAVKISLGCSAPISGLPHRITWDCGRTGLTVNQDRHRQRTFRSHRPRAMVGSSLISLLRNTVLECVHHGTTRDVPTQTKRGESMPVDTKPRWDRSAGHRFQFGTSRSGLNTCPPLPTGMMTGAISRLTTARNRSGDSSRTASMAAGVPSGMPSNTCSIS